MSSILNTISSHISPRTKRTVSDLYSTPNNNTNATDQSNTYSALQRAFQYSSTTPSCTTARKRTVKGSHSWIIRGFTDLPLNDKTTTVDTLTHSDSNTTQTTLSSTTDKLKPFIHSQEFEIGGYKWKMELWPNGDTVTSSDSEGWITLYLCCCTQLKDNQELRRRAEFRFLNWCTPDCDMVCSLGWATYSAAQPAWGRRKALQRTELINNSQWLKNDQLILVCEVEVDLDVQIEHMDAATAIYNSCDLVTFTKVAKDYMNMLCHESGQDVTLVCQPNTVRHKNYTNATQHSDTVDQPRSNTPVYNSNNKRRRLIANSSDDETNTDDLQGLDVTNNSNEVRAHKSILSSRSKVFNAMFRNDYVEKNANCVPLYGITVDTLKQLLQYIYTGAIAVDDLQHNTNNESAVRTDDARQQQPVSTDDSSSTTQLQQSTYHTGGIGMNQSILNEFPEQYASPITTWTQALDLYDAAVYYDVADCAIDCAKLIGKTLTVDNAPTTLQFVLNHSAAPGIDIIKTYLKPFTQ